LIFHYTTPPSPPLLLALRVLTSARVIPAFWALQ
jgi:hypothetical protein